MQFIRIVRYFGSINVDIYLTRNLQPVIGPIHMSLNHHGSWMGTKFITPELSCRFQLVCGHVLVVGAWLGVAVVFGRL